MFHAELGLKLLLRRVRVSSRGHQWLLFCSVVSASVAVWLSRAPHTAKEDHKTGFLTRFTPSHPSSLSALPRATTVHRLWCWRALLQTDSFVTMQFDIDAFGRGGDKGRGLVERGRER